ncbi:hypothetical protein M1D88_05075 [Arthrobacter sp. R1-13]
MSAQDLSDAPHLDQVWIWLFAVKGSHEGQAAEGGNKASNRRRHERAVVTWIVVAVCLAVS